MAFLDIEAVVESTLEHVGVRPVSDIDDVLTADAERPVRGRSSAPPAAADLRPCRPAARADHRGRRRARAQRWPAAASGYKWGAHDYVVPNLRAAVPPLCRKLPVPSSPPGTGAPLRELLLCAHSRRSHPRQVTLLIAFWGCLLITIHEFGHSSSPRCSHARGALLHSLPAPLEASAGETDTARL